MLGNLLRVPRPHLPRRAAYSILPVGALKEVGGLPFLTSRQPNDAPKPPSTGATCVSDLGRPSLSLSLALPHPPASMHRESGSNCFLAYPFLCFFVLPLIVSVSFRHCRFPKIPLRIRFVSTLFFQRPSRVSHGPLFFTAKQ
jgi:hypothetical protein